MTTTLHVMLLTLLGCVVLVAMVVTVTVIRSCMTVMQGQRKATPVLAKPLTSADISQLIEAEQRTKRSLLDIQVRHSARPQ